MALATNSRPRLTREEKVGLIIAAAAHAALFAWLALDPPGKPIVALPERMTVNLSADSAPQATSPAPVAEPAEALAPELGEDIAADEAEAMPAAEPVAAATPVPSPPPAQPRARPAAAPAPEAAARPAARPTSRPSAKPAARPIAEKPAPKPAAKPLPKDERARRRPDAPVGASRIGNDFLKGVAREPTSGRSLGQPTAAAGPQVAASLSQAIARQLKPHWTAPQGADAEKLVTVLAWELNPDGSLAGRPRLVSQSGITDANRAQKDRHAEQAIRAVQVAAPFRLPQQHYASWRRVTAFRFDRKLDR